MRNNIAGPLSRDARREQQRRRLHTLSYLGLAVLAAATIVVVVMALRR
jgi:hypothetical protein